MQRLRSCGRPASATTRTCWPSATFSLPCREVFARGQKTIAVVGPVKGVAQQILAVHEGYWNADSPVVGLPAACATRQSSVTSVMLTFVSIM